MIHDCQQGNLIAVQLTINELFCKHWNHVLLHLNWDYNNWGYIPCIINIGSWVLSYILIRQLFISVFTSVVQIFLIFVWKMSHCEYIIHMEQYSLNWCAEEIYRICSIYWQIVSIYTSTNTIGCCIDVYLSIPVYTSHHKWLKQ